MVIDLEPQEWQQVLNILQQAPWAAVNGIINKIMQQGSAPPVIQAAPATLNGAHPAPPISGE